MKAGSLQVLLVLSVWCLVTPAGGQPKAPLKCSTECGHFISRIAVKRIRSYRRTEPQCSREAIIFITLKSMEVCADPKADWVKMIVARLDKEKATGSPLPGGATPAAVPREPAGFEKQIGLTAAAPSQSQATAPTSYFQGTDTTVLERIRAPAAGVEASSKSPPSTEDSVQLPAGSAPTTGGATARSEVTSEASRDSLRSPAPSATLAAGVVSSQPTLHPTAPVHGFGSTTGAAGEPVGRTANTGADVRGTTSPSSSSDPMAVPKGSDHPLLSTNKSLGPTSTGANAPDAASSNFSSDLPSILDSMDTTTVPATPVPPTAASASALDSTTATGKGPSVRTNEAISSSADAFGTRTFDYSSPAGKQEPSATLAFASRAFSGQARVQLPTANPKDLPLPSSLSRSQMYLVILVSVVVGGLVAPSVAAVWLHLKCGAKPEEMAGEMVQGLLYHERGHQGNVYSMEVI
ncbi:fractalkine [Falco cherrug]|uniref:fractalkine n=1 Tax=Falco cherrug TaxID=345164 RepID=UPI00247A469C|nr:fractalkine [Falco cherrug]